MTKNRCHIAYATQLAAALRQLGNIDHEHAKMMTEKQMRSLWHLDHDIPLGIRRNNHHSNLTWRFIGHHRIKTKSDVKKIAKAKRIDVKWKPFMAAVAMGLKPPPKPRSKWAKRRFQARAR